MAKSRKIRDWLCTYEGCDSKFPKSSMLKRHLLSHDTENTFKCIELNCDKRYKVASHLARHIEEDHNENPPVSCPHEGCHVKLKRSRSLEKHLKIHDQNKCTTCGKTFHKRFQLKKHEFEHTGLKKCICSYPNCGKSFEFPNKLRVHEKIHKGYGCETCRLVCKTWGELRKHKADVHKNKICNQCNKSFTTIRGLRNHKTTHADTKEALHCSYKDCTRYYFSSKTLNQHIKAFHLKEKVKCDLCQKEFMWKKSLNSHLKTHEPGYVAPKRTFAKVKPMECKLSGLSQKCAKIIENRFDSDLLNNEHLNELEEIQNQQRTIEKPVLALDFQNNNCMEASEPNISALNLNDDLASVKSVIGEILTSII